MRDEPREHPGACPAMRAGPASEADRRLTHMGSEHDALHTALECPGETLWQARRQGRAPDQHACLDCLARRAQ